MKASDKPMQIAKQFSHLIRDELSKSELATVIERNRINPKESCATHDFCDANVLMAEAFERVMGRAMRTKSEIDMALAASAWGIAKQRGFNPEECR